MRGPLPGDETLAARWGRRALTIPGYLAMTVALWTLLPIVLPAALLVDALRRRPFPIARLVLFLAFYLGCESLGLVAAGTAWLASGSWAGAAPERYARWNHRLQGLWARLLLWGVRRIYDVELEVSGAGAIGRGPLLVFCRHASVGDTILPAVLISAQHDVRLRYVIKRELLWDPCLDVVGQRVPNVFVRRDSADSERELDAVRRLAEHLADDEGVLIFPEGTRFSPAKRERVLARLERAHDPGLVARARQLHHVLPPRLGGPLALLEASPEADVLFLAHVGFEGTASFRQLWRGALIGRRIRVAFGRAPATEIPRGREERVAWLYNQWSRLDAWIEAHRAETLPSAA